MKVSRRFYKLGNFYSFFLAFASASSVAAWALWKSYPTVWAGIVAVSQVLHIAKPYIPFIKNDKEFMEMSLLYETLYILYEKLWYGNENSNIDSIESKFYELRDQELDISQRYKHIICPEFNGLIKDSSKETAKELSLHFN
jgi:hypothetical protein